MLYNKYSVHAAYLYFVEGVLKGKLFTKGKRRLLSEIEKGDGTVLVNLYSKKDVKKLFPKNKWKIKTITFHKYVKEDFVFIHRFLPKIFFNFVEKYFGFFMVLELKKK